MYHKFYFWRQFYIMSSNHKQEQVKVATTLEELDALEKMCNDFNPQDDNIEYCNYRPCLLVYISGMREELALLESMNELDRLFDMIEEWKADEEFLKRDRLLDAMIEEFKAGEVFLNWEDYI